MLDGDKVAIVVSLGKEAYDLPKLAGLTVDQAQDKILDTKLAFGKAIEEFSETVDEGIVIASDPKAGTTLRPGAIVDLIVSKGRQPIPVGDWVGKDADRAEQVLERRGLRSSARPEYDDDVADGPGHRPGPRRRHAVQGRHGRDPRLARTRARRGAQRGRARASSRATETLTDLGFVVVTEEAPGYLGLGFVFSMDPEAGHRAAQGSTITLYLI